MAASLATMSHGSFAMSRDMVDVKELLDRINELEAAVTAALHVNQHLNKEVENYVRVLESSTAECEAWKQRAQWLSEQLVHTKKQQAHTAADFNEQQAVADMLQQAIKQADSKHQQQEQTLGAAGTSAGSTALQLTPSQEKLLHSLKAKGTAAGWLIDASEVQLGAMLGEGMFGVTYQATWRGSQVAVKCVRVSSTTEMTTFLREVEALSAVRHPHVLPFLGACIFPPDRCWLVTEYMERGTLAAWLHPHRYPGGGTGGGGPNPHLAAQHGGQGAAHANGTAHAADGDAAAAQFAGAPLATAASSAAVHRPGAAALPAVPPPRNTSLIDRVRLVYEVAQGMQALEAVDPPLLHRDLKPSNVFVDGAGHARVADFGLSRRLLAGAVADLTGETGTYLYMAPEVVRHEVYDAKADVWSWGVMLVEAMAQEAPYASTFLTPVQVALAVAEEQLCPTIPTNVPVDLQVIAKLALSFSPEERPSFSFINAELQGIYAKMLKQQEAPAPSLIATVTRSLTSRWTGLLGRLYSMSTGTAADSAAAAAAAQDSVAGPQAAGQAAPTKDSKAEEGTEL